MSNVCSLPFRAADGGSGASSRRALQWIAKNLRKCKKCPCVLTTLSA